MIRLIYIADPMCSWCYGFGLQLDELLDALPEAQLDIILVGLRAYYTEALDEAGKAAILTHWRQVEKASRLPFSTSGIVRPGFLYDTEPTCRTVVTAHILGQDLPLTQDSGCLSCYTARFNHFDGYFRHFYGRSNAHRTSFTLLRL